MPEGHTIHRYAREQQRLLGRRPVGVTSPQGRFAADADRIDGAVLERVEPYGKHLFYHWSTGEIGHVHLGLFGGFRVQRSSSDDVPPPRGEVRMRLQADVTAKREDRRHVTIDLSGPTACTLDAPDVRERILARLGPDPLARGADGRAMIEKVARSRRTIGDLILDQSVVAGVGNVYRAEALFVTRIHPARPGRECGTAELQALWSTVSGMLAQGLRDGRIITVDPTELGLPPGTNPPRGERTYVYKRDRCTRCGDAIRTVELGGRPCYYCPTDQPT